MNYRLYLRQAGVLFSATALAQLINFAAYPLLSRTYDSAAFGYFSVFVGAVSIIGPLACGRFDVVVQAAPHSQRFAVLKLANILSGWVGLASAVGYALLAPEIQGIAQWISALLFGGCIVLVGFCFSGTAFLIKHEAYRQNGLAIVFRAALTAIPQIILFWALPDARGLILGFASGIIAQAAVIRASIRPLSLREAGLRKVHAMARRYSRYPIYDLPSTFLSAIVLFANNFFLFDLYGPDEAGYFSFAFRLAALPLALLAASLSQVFFEKASKTFQQSTTYWQPFRFNLIVSSGMAIAVFILTLLAARPAVDIYLGTHWRTVAVVLIILAPMMAARFIFVSISAAPLVIGKPRRLLVANCVLALAVLIVFVIAKQVGMEFETYLRITSLSMAIIYLILITIFSMDARSGKLSH